MKLVTQTIYSCDNCGKTFTWDRNSRSILRCFGKDYAGWEHDFTLCSDTCGDLFILKTKAEQKKIALNGYKR